MHYASQHFTDKMTNYSALSIFRKVFINFVCVPFKILVCGTVRPVSESIFEVMFYCVGKVNALLSLPYSMYYIEAVG
jgi:hypothetical protein